MRCFISHASPDRPLAEAVGNYLCATIPGFSVFLASVPGQIPADAQWFDTIQDEMHRANLYLVIVTPASVSRPWIWFETGAGWMSGRQLFVTIAGTIRKQDVPPPLGFFQISSLESVGEVAALIRQLGGRPRDIETFCAQVQQLARQAIETAALEEGWEGVELHGRYFAWEGPRLHELQDYPPIPTPAGLVDALKEKGLVSSYGVKARLTHHFAQGRKQVFETDRTRWRREILYTDDPDQVLLVRRG